MHLFIINKKISAIILGFAFLISGCMFSPEKDQRNVVRRTLDDYVLSNRISGVVSILSDSNYNLTIDCSGWANVEKQIPISTNTLFAIFSMTKDCQKTCILVV
jgi:hypothetical protein